MLVLLGRWFDWRGALIVVKPSTFITWHRRGFRLFWRWKSAAGRRPIPTELQQLIGRMARDNPSWGEERIANELQLKLGLRVSPRTVPGRRGMTYTEDWVDDEATSHRRPEE
jgi:putative transposase